MPHFVYMLRCKGNRIYTGYAVDVDARFKQHSEGKGARFTKAFPPECILRQFELKTKEEALRLEARIKKLSPSQKKLLVASDMSATPIETELLAGLKETLEEKARRIRKEKRTQKDKTTTQG